MFMNQLNVHNYLELGPDRSISSSSSELDTGNFDPSVPPILTEELIESDSQKMGYIWLIWDY
jgi:hypothetical protein